jgi:two-component system cell cycle response regulator
MMKGDPETIRQERERAAQQPACLIVVRGTPQGHRYFLTQDQMVIGRDPTADIVVQDANVSRKHAVLTKDGQSIVITDQGSSNGTKVNGKLCEAGKGVKLGKEDMIGMGTTQFKFLPAGELETLYYGNLGDAANMDPLTGIYNKGFLLQAIEVEFKRHKALHSDFSVAFFDLDHFKKINDTYGHDAGDFVLKEITRLIFTSALRPKDVFARYGGEEFVILMGNSNAEQAQAQCEKIRSMVEGHFFGYEDKRIPVTVSMGVAQLDSQVESAQTLLRQADKALYAAKSGGRNRVVIATR